jgi:hypothetical protein
LSNTIEVYTKDELKIFDELNKKQKLDKTGPVGWVKVLFDNELHHEGFNMILAQGREYINKKIFNKSYQGYYISHFGIGSGGPTVDGGTITPVSPKIDRTSLYRNIGLGNSSYLDFGTTQDCLKPIGSSNIILQTVQHDSSNFQTTTKCVCEIDPNEPDIEEYQLVNEAGLFFTSSSSNPKMFSHITFAPKYKEPTGSISISWYIVC